LVRDSIFEQTGKRYVTSDITSDTAQYQYLMDNALAEKEELKLTPYVRLSAEQIASLTKDIVWMESREVDGQQVLVPVVYIANAALAKTTDNGAKIIANGDINLNTNTITNQGEISSGGSTTLSASGNIYNEGGSINANDALMLQANGGIYNISSNLSAQIISITANTFQSDIDAQTLSKTYAGIGTQTSQLLSDISTISALNSISIQTTNNLSLIGTTLNAGGALTLSSTEGDIAISSKTHTDTYDFTTKASGYDRGTTVHEVGSSINADSISLSSTNLLVNASDVTATNDMNIKADNIAITAGEDRVYTDSKYVVKGGFMGGGKKTADTVDKKEVISSTLSAKNLNIDTTTLSIQGSKLTAEQANIASEVIELISLKNSDYESHFSDSSGMMTRTIASKGHIKEEVVSAMIQVQNQLIINNKDVTNQLQTDNLVKTITSQSGLSIEQIKLVEAYAKSEEWDKKTTSLTGMGTLIIAAVVTVCTMGAGGYLVGLEAANAAAASTAAIAAETGTAAATAAAASAASAATTATIQAAVVQSIVTQVANALVTAAITGNNPNIDMASLVKGAVLAGVTSYTSMTGYTNVGDLGYGSVVNKIAQGGVNAGIKTAITGSNLKDNLINEMAQNVYTYVGDVSLSASWDEGSLNKIILHGAVGAGVAAAKGEDVLAGAASGAVAELARPLTDGQDKTIQSTVSSVIGGITAGAVGGDASVNVGSYIGQTSDQFNRQLHEDEIKFIKDKTKEYSENNQLNETQAEELLKTAALYYIDQKTKNNLAPLTQEQIDAGFVSATPYTKDQIVKAYNYLLTESAGKQFSNVYYESFTNQDYFTATQDQYKNPNYTPSTAIGLKDVSLDVIPLVTGATSGAIALAKGVDGIVGKEVVQGVETSTNNDTIKIIAQYNPTTEIGPLSPSVVNTFRSGTYVEGITTEPTILYRVYGGTADELGRYWTTTPPTGSLQSIIDSALDPVWGNSAVNIAKIEVPTGVKLYQGQAASQSSLVGGGNQIYIPKVDKSWIK